MYPNIRFESTQKESGETNYRTVPNLQIAMMLSSHDGAKYHVVRAVPLSHPAEEWMPPLPSPDGEAVIEPAYFPSIAECEIPFTENDMEKAHLVSVYVASPGFCANLEIFHPKQLKTQQTISMVPLPHGGSSIFQWGIGRIYPLEGEIRIFWPDIRVQGFVVTNNIAINGSTQDFPIPPGNTGFELRDVNGKALKVEIMDSISELALVQYVDASASEDVPLSSSHAR